MRGSLFLISLSAIYLQISLIRYMANVYYGNMTYFIISVALLGFGASGTLLTLREKKKPQNKLNPFYICSSALFFTSLALLMIPRIPLNLLYLLYDNRQILLLSIYSIVLFLPFFFCGMFIGNFLINSKKKAGDYGINLLGSGAGALASLSLMYFFDPVKLPSLTLMPLAVSTALLLSKGRTKKGLLYLLAAFSISVAYWFFPMSGAPDQYKDISRYHLLEDQGEARNEASSFSPYGKREAWYSPYSHSTLFAGLNNTYSPPDQLTLFSDNDFIGSLFMADDIEQVSILHETIQSLPYRIMPEADVLIVGDIGLTNLWLALLYKARSITILLPDNELEQLLFDDLRRWTTHAKDDRVKIISSDYRKFFLLNKDLFDLIHFASSESLKGSMSGLNGYREDYLLTVESLKEARESLKEGGVLTISRGKLLPPKDNYKIAELMEKAGSRDLVRQYENYLAVNSLLFKTPPAEYQLRRLNEAVSVLNLTRYNRKSDELSKMFDLRAPHDNRPFFHSFFRLQSIGNYTRIDNPYWFRESHMSYLILLITFIFIVAVAFMLILFPHLKERQPLKVPFLLYFLLIGIAFMFVEMVLIQKMSLFLGHSSFSISLVLSALLIFSGLGSLFIERIKGKRGLFLFFGLIVIGIFTLTAVLFSDQLLRLSAWLRNLGAPFLWLFILLYCGTCSFFMGWFFAPGLSLLESKHRSSLPVAWALNGFASVAASPLAVLLSLSFGFIAPLSLAILFYLLAAALFSCQNRMLDV